MNDSLIARLRNNNKATANNLIQPKNVNLNLEEYFNKLLLDLKEGNYTNDDIRFMIDNIKTTVEYSKKIIENK